MRNHDRVGLHQGVEEDYEHEDYDEYEEEASESEDDIVQEDPKPTKEEQEYLKLREQLKDKIRQKLKKQSASASGHLSQSQDKRRTVANDKFGSFFGPSQPVIAPRVIEESRSIRDTQHILAKVPNSSSSNKKAALSSSTEIKTNAHDQQVKDVKERTNKAQALKNMRDYSFLLSDDADLPDPEKDQPAPRKASVQSSGPAHLLAPRKDMPASRKVSVPISAQAPLKSKLSTIKPARSVYGGHDLKNSVSTTQHMQPKVGSVKEALMSRTKPASTEPRKGSGVGVRNEPGRPVGHKALPPKVSAQAVGTIKPPARVMNDPSTNKKPSSAKPHSSIQNHYSEQKRVIQGPDRVKITPKQSLPSSKVQLSKQVPPRGIREDRSKKRPVKRHHEEDDDDAIQMIRNMFKYNPSKYADIDDQDDSDMEVGFDRILREERRSSLIARKEDEEELRLEEEERRARMRKKQKK